MTAALYSVVSVSPVVARGSLGGLPLRAALTRGALVTAANWQVILVQFVSVSMFRLALAVPVVGGAFMVAVLAEADVQALFADGVRSAAALVFASLLDRPAALWSFVAAAGVVALGGGVILCLTDAGVMGLLARGERAAGDVQRMARRLDVMRHAATFSIEHFLEAVGRLGRRFVWLGAGLYLGYGLIATGAIGLMAAAAALAARGEWSAVVPFSAVIVTAASLVAVACLQLAHALLQAIVVTDDCRLRVALGRLREFLMSDARQVLGIFGVVLALVMLATAASLLATAGLALVAWVPFVGLVVVPLQLAAWLVRGVVFHYMDLSAWSAYQSQYRRYAEPDATEPVLHAVRMSRA
jgi:hypothetical protein